MQDKLKALNPSGFYAKLWLNRTVHACIPCDQEVASQFEELSKRPIVSTICVPASMQKGKKKECSDYMT